MLLLRAFLMILLCHGLLLSSGAAQTGKDPLAQWPQWRGPLANGVAPAADPPVRWGSEQNLRWRTPLPGQGTSTPILWNHRIFLLSARATDKPAENPPARHPEAMTEPPAVYHRFMVLCVEADSGRVLWERVAREEVPHEGHHPTHTYAAGSPTTDGERLYVSFGSRGVFAFTLEGELLWERRLGTMRTRNGWGESSTPAVHGQSLFVVWDQEDDSYLYCLDAATGETKWRVSRDEPTNWSTPLVAAEADPPQLVVNGTRRARGYDLTSGKVLWECGELSVNAIPSPVLAGGLAYCMSGYRRSVIYAVPLTSRGDVSGTDQVGWTYTRDTPYVASPVVHDGLLYMTKDRSAILSILQADTGEAVRVAERIPDLGDMYASPLLAGGRLYLVDRRGRTAVLEAGRQGRVLAVNDLNDAIDASPVAVGRRLYLRSWTALYCLEEKETGKAVAR